VRTGAFRTSDLEQLRMSVLEHLGMAQAPAWLFAAELREGTVLRLLKERSTSAFRARDGSAMGGRRNQRGASGCKGGRGVSPCGKTANAQTSDNLSRLQETRLPQDLG
jgi:hypothetical protein